MPELKTRYGVLQVPDEDDLIAAYLARYGEWAYIETLVASQFVSGGSLVFDLGAFVGTFTLGLDQLIENIDILSIEPGAIAYEMLAANIAGRANIRSDNCAIGEFPGMFSSSVHTDTGNLGASAMSVSENSSKAELTRFVRLSDLREKYGAPDFIKMDIEGAELAALNSDRRWLSDNKPTLWVECNETRASLKLCIELLKCGYELFYVAFPSFNPDNFLSEVEEIHPMAHEAALLAMVPGRKGELDCVIPPSVTVKQVKSVNDLRRALFYTPRWCKKEWLDLKRDELYALLGRLEKDTPLEAFLPED